MLQSIKVCKNKNSDLVLLGEGIPLPNKRGRKMKKIIAVFFAVALLIACFAVSASAATDIERGEEIQIKLSVDEYTGIKSGSVEFFFDEDVFEIVHGEWLISGAMLTDFNTDSARGVFAFASAKTVRTDVFSLTLQKQRHPKIWHHPSHAE